MAGSGRRSTGRGCCVRYRVSYASYGAGEWGAITYYAMLFTYIVYMKMEVMILLFSFTMLTTPYGA